MNKEDRPYGAIDEVLPFPAACIEMSKRISKQAPLSILVGKALPFPAACIGMSKRIPPPVGKSLKELPHVTHRSVSKVITESIKACKKLDLIDKDSVVCTYHFDWEWNGYNNLLATNSLSKQSKDSISFDIIVAHNYENYSYVLLSYFDRQCKHSLIRAAKEVAPTVETYGMEGTYDILIPVI